MKSVLKQIAEHVEIEKVSCVYRVERIAESWSGLRDIQKEEHLEGLALVIKAKTESDPQELLHALEKIQANQRLPGLEDVLPTIEDKLNPEKIEGSMLREKIISLVESNPGKAAQVVHEMIHTAESQKEIA